MESLVSSYVVAVALNSLNAGDVSRGHTNNSSFEVGCLLHPLKADGGNAFHAVVLFELFLGSESSVIVSGNGYDSAGSVELNFRLDNIEKGCNKSAVPSDNSSSEVGVESCNAVCVSSSGFGGSNRGVYAETKGEGISSELFCILVSASFCDSGFECGNVHGAGGMESLVSKNVVAVALNKLKSCNIVSGHAYNCCCESVSLGVPLSADGGNALHAIVLFFLLFGTNVNSGEIFGNKAVSYCEFGLCAVELAFYDFAFGVGNNYSNGSVNLSLSFFRRFGAYYDAHTEFVGLCYRSGIFGVGLFLGRGFLAVVLIYYGLVVAGASCEGENHYESEEKCKKFFHD